MTTEYSSDKQLIKDFIRWASDTHKCALVSFPDEFAASQFVNYKFVNTSELLDQFMKERGNGI